MIWYMYTLWKKVPNDFINTSITNISITSMLTFSFFWLEHFSSTLRKSWFHTIVLLETGIMLYIGSSDFIHLVTVRLYLFTKLSIFPTPSIARQPLFYHFFHSIFSEQYSYVDEFKASDLKYSKLNSFIFTHWRAPRKLSLQVRIHAIMFCKLMDDPMVGLGHLFGSSLILSGPVHALTLMCHFHLQSFVTRVTHL